MIERRFIRVLTTYSKTPFFIDQGTPRGLVPDAFKLFEDDLNKKLKNKNLRVQVVIVPVAHDELVPALLEGRGDIVAAGKLITDWRKAARSTSRTRRGPAFRSSPSPGPACRRSRVRRTSPGARSTCAPSDVSERRRRALQRRRSPPPASRRCA